MSNAKVWMLCIAAALSGCHNKDSGPADPAPAPAPRVSVAAPVKKGPTAQELTSGMVEAASQGKSQLPVELKFDVGQRPMVGQALDVAVAVVPQISGSPASIQVTGAEGLNVAQDSTHFDIPIMEAGGVYRQSIKLTPTADGIAFLGLTISLKHDEITESRDFSIPLIVAR